MTTATATLACTTVKPQADGQVVRLKLVKKFEYDVNQPGGIHCAFCNFRFSLQSLLDLHVVECAKKHTSTQCNLCGQDIPGTLDFDEHMSHCLAQTEMRLEREERERREQTRRQWLENRARKFEEMFNPSPQPRTPLCEQYNGKIKAQDDETVVKLAQFRSLDEMAQKNHFHAEAVIYDNFEEAANRLDGFYRDAFNHWNSGVAYEVAAKATQEKRV